MARDSDGSAGYWVVVSLLCVFGVAGIFSVGMPFLLLGVTLAAVSPWRAQRAVLWPAVTAVVGFVVGYILVAPLSCRATASSVVPGQSTTVPGQSTTCTNVLGIDYSGTGVYNPSLVPALLAGLTVSVAAAAAFRVVLKRKEVRRHRLRDASPTVAG